MVQLNSSNNSGSAHGRTSCMRGTAPSSDTLGAHGQSRSRDEAGRLMVQFDTAAAARNALAEAAVVETLAWDSAGDG